MPQLGNLVLGNATTPAPTIASGVAQVQQTANITDNGYRVRAINRDGTVISDALPHVGSIVFQRFSIQIGAQAGAGQLGTAKIPLYPPNSPEGISAAAAYKQLSFGVRIEIYKGLGTVPENTYVIHKKGQDYTKDDLDCIDSLWIAQSGVTQRKEFFNGHADDLFRYCLSDYQMVYGDDFATQDMSTTNGSGHYYQVGAPNGSSSFTTNSNWTPASQEGMTGAVCSGMTAGTRYFMHNNWGYPASYYQNARLDADIIINAVQGNSYISAGLIFGYNNLSNSYIVAELGVDVSGAIGTETNPTPIPAYLRIQNGQNSPSTGTVLKDVLLGAGIVNASTLTIRAQLRIYSIYRPATNDYVFHLLLNGENLGCIVANSSAPAGASGAYAYSANGTGSVFVANLYHDYKQPIFQGGSITPSPNPVFNHKMQQDSLLDVMLTAAAADKVQIRKNPQAGWNNDVLDFGSSLGVATNVRFVEGQNLITVTTGQNLEKPGSILQVQGQGGGDNGTVYTARNLAAIKRFGYFYRQENREQHSTFQTLRAVGQAEVGLTGDANVAKSVMVDLTGVEGTFRELDTVIITSPTLGLNESRQLVVGIEETEGARLTMLHLGQYPMEASLKAEMAKIRQTIDNLVTGSTAGQGADLSVYDNVGFYKPPAGLVVSPTGAVVNLAPSAVTNLAFTTGIDNSGQVNNAYIQLTFTAPPNNQNVSGYNIRICRAPGGVADGNYKFYTTPATSAFKISGLYQNTQYSIDVKTINWQKVESAWAPVPGPVISANSTAPVAPTGVTAIKSPRGALVSWAGNSEADLQGYLVRVSLNGGAYVSVTPAASLTTSLAYIAPSGTAVGSTLAFQVAAINWSGQVSAYTTAVNTTTDGVVFDELLAGTLKVFGTLTAGGGLTTSASGIGARLTLDNSGLKIYNSAGTNTVALNGDGSASYTGTLAAGNVVTGAISSGTPGIIPSPPATGFQLDPTNGLQFTSGGSTLTQFKAGYSMISSGLSGPAISLNADSNAVAGTSPLMKVTDGTYNRVQLGNLAAGPGGSTAHYGLRGLDVNGNLLFDTIGLAQVMTVIASITSTGTITAAGNATVLTVAGTNTGSWTLARPTTVLVMGLITGYIRTSAGNPITYGGNVRLLVSGQTASPWGSIPKSGASDPVQQGSGTLFQVLSLAAGSYTAEIDWTGTNFDTLNGYDRSVYVFKLGG